MTGPIDRLDSLREKPQLRPYIVAEPVPTLVVLDAAGRFRAYALGDLGLAELALSAAEAQARRARSEICRVRASKTSLFKERVGAWLGALRGGYTQRQRRDKGS